eukprot:scaffold8447_cov186-Amphora_coffeaeformis.AAC.4
MSECEELSKNCGLGSLHLRGRPARQELFYSTIFHMGSKQDSRLFVCCDVDPGTPMNISTLL